MSTSIELDERRRQALEQVARRRKVPVRRLLERAVDEFIERTENEELLASSARTAQQKGLHEKDAAAIVREWRSKRVATRRN